MPEERDYDLAIYKVPRKDKDGRDITGDKIGPGGRHRGNGTYSGVAYDPELLDDRLLYPGHNNRRRTHGHALCSA